MPILHFVNRKAQKSIPNHQVWEKLLFINHFIVYAYFKAYAKEKIILYNCN